MATYPVDWVDAFTAQAFGGNGCAVLHDAGDLEDDTCCKVVRETSLVECTFVEPSDIANFKVRYFLAEREIPFAGHPTVATVASLIHRGKVTAESIKLETGAGIIPIEIDYATVGGPNIVMQQARPSFGQVVPVDVVAGISGLSPSDIVGTPQVVSTGLPFVVTVLKDHDALRRATVSKDALIEMRQTIKHPDADVMEPYLVTLQGIERGDTFSRLLMVPPSPAEDPFTGSATGCAAAYLWKHGLIENPNYVAEQGHWMGRPGTATVEIIGPRDDISAVKVGGQGYVLMSGDIHI